VEHRTNRIVLAGGGTAGHLYPALAVAEELGRRHPRASIVFVGATRGLEQRLVPSRGYPLRTLSLDGIKGASVTGRLRSAALAGWAVLRCAMWMIRERPDVVIGVGGYASGPAVLAAKLLQISTMVMEQNHFPGATNRWLAPRVDAVCLPSEAARTRIGGRHFVTGNPVRREFFEIGARSAGDPFGLLVFGGSRGARSINRAMCAALDELSRVRPSLSIVHQTGPEDHEHVRTACTSYAGAHPIQVGPFFEDMATRFAQADLIVCRAGATTLSELCAAGRPAILVPYPHAADDHQSHNAETLRQAGAAVVLRDADLDGPVLVRTVADLAGDTDRLRAMSRAARALARPDAAQRIADVADGLLRGRLVQDDDVS
jgi:UDP-N-acetylglucosamine--N-acetylmuramyl-(pentapeptide) pyrophosphoryl-undecaprenol N-acetylglucosamine transferase